MNSKKNISQIVCWALTAPPVAGCSSQAASDSDAATRRQTQIDDIASSDLRLVKKALYCSYYQLPSIIKVKPQNFHFFEVSESSDSKIRFF